MRLLPTASVLAVIALTRDRHPHLVRGLKSAATVVGDPHGLWAVTMLYATAGEDRAERERRYSEVTNVVYRNSRGPGYALRGVHQLIGR